MDDKYQIDELIKRFFSIFKNTGNQSPDWSIINETCLPELLIIKKEGKEQEVYTLETFIAPRKKLLTAGNLIEFEEKEIKEETKIIGNIAQRYSVYTKKGKLNGTYFTQNGNKLFQLVNTQSGWRINAIVWEDV